MSRNAWKSLDGRAERAKRSWSETTLLLPVGELVRTRVLARMPFGIFVEIDGHPDALGLMEITTFPPAVELPAVDVYLDAVVLDHAP